MHISEVGPALIDTEDGIVGVDVSVGMLRGSDHVDSFLNDGHELIIFLSHQKVTRGFNDFIDITIPERLVESVYFSPIAVASAVDLHEAGFRVLLSTSDSTNASETSEL